MSKDMIGKSDPEMFKAIARDATLAIRVAREIERVIIDNHLVTGDRMLSERELGERFGVSRTVIREAVRSLAAKGMLEVRTGDGTYVQDRSQASASEALARLMRVAGAGSTKNARAHAVYEVRRPLEIAIAGLAAERVTDDDLANLRTWIEVLGSDEKNEAEYIEADVRFHVALAEAAHNQIFIVLLDSIEDLMKAIRALGVSVGGSRDEGRRHHQRILDRVAAHDVEGARLAMSEHMDDSERILNLAIAALGTAA